MSTQRIMPEIDKDICILCGDCVAACPNGSLTISPEKDILLDEETCGYCGVCEDICPVGAIRLPYDIVLAVGNKGD